MPTCSKCGSDMQESFDEDLEPTVSNDGNQRVSFWQKFICPNCGYIDYLD